MMQRSYPALAALVLLTMLAPVRAEAGKADVIAADVALETRMGDQAFYRFSVTVRHDDEGWDHYADAFEVLGPDGTVLGTRVLVHPHENEQPFTRSLGAVGVPEGVSEVTIRARDSVHGLGGKTLTVTLPDR